MATKVNTITREMLSKLLAREFNLKLIDSNKYIDVVINEIIKTLISKDGLKIRFFGVFSKKDKKQRIGRNPKTGKVATISARKVISFRIAPTLKKRINSNLDLISF